jgi:TIR domain
MRVLDTLKVFHGSEEKLIQICHGDLTALSPDEAVDVLIVSAFPDDYLETRGSLIGSLGRRGLHVGRLAWDKYADWRKEFSCWASKEIEPTLPGLHYKRILCFETRGGTPPERIGDIFRGLNALLNDNLMVETAAMPLVACGDQAWPMRAILAPLLEAAVNWMTIGLPLRVLKIVAYSDDAAAELEEQFGRLKGSYERLKPETGGAAEYDVFISYAHKDNREASLLVKSLKTCKPDLSIFLDRLSLDVGAAWQQKIYEAIDRSRKVVAVFSPSYVNSKVCLEEFNIGLCRRRKTGNECLFPVYLYSAELPTYMEALVNYVDCREGSETKLRDACDQLLSSMSP